MFRHSDNIFAVRKRWSLLGYCQAPSISKSKKQRALSRFRWWDPFVSNIFLFYQFNWIQRTWDQELRKLRKRDKKQSSPTCSKGTLCISVSCVRAPVLDLLHMLHPGSFVRHTGDLRTSNLLASHLNSPAQAMKICKDIVSWHQLV